MFSNTRGLGNYGRDVVRILSTYRAESQYILFTPEQNDLIDRARNCRVVEPQKFIDKAFPSLWRTKRICNDISQAELDVYHGLSNELPVGIERCGVATVLTMHDVLFLTSSELYPFVDRQIYKRKYLASCRRADRIIAISESTKSDLVDIVGLEPERIDVVRQGCDPVFYQTATQERKQQVKERFDLPEEYILTVGALEERKNHELIFRAMKRMKDDVRLVVVGHETKYAAHLRRRVEGLGLSARVLFRHEVATSDLAVVYGLASVFVFPSMGEGFGRPILEAMASGVPVVTSEDRCLRETGGEAAVYVDSDDEGELSVVLDNLLENRELRETMMERGKKRAALFSDAEIAENLMNVYRKVI